MDLYTFNQKEMKERTQLVWEQGSFLARRIDQDQPVELYHMGGFFVEVYYTPKYRPTTIFGFFSKHAYWTSVRAFHHRLNLDPYLALITLPAL